MTKVSEIKLKTFLHKLVSSEASWLDAETRIAIIDGIYTNMVREGLVPTPTELPAVGDILLEELQASLDTIEVPLDFN